MISPNASVLMLIASIAVPLAVVLISILILWVIIRSAVLSALRKHRSEVHGAVGDLYRGE